MLKRKIYNDLIKWKSTKNKECLLIKGARQVGKTYIIRQFGKTEYKSFIEINFFEHPEYANIFEGSLAAEDIYKKISLYVPNVNFVKNDTLIFLDEIQHCPKARTALKFLAIENSYDIITSGSLLGLHYKEIESIPVGYERQIEMFAMDFEEFLWATGRTEQTINILEKHFNKKEKLDAAIHEQFIQIVREYMVVGGMPEVVQTFLDTNNYQATNSVQNKILESYKDDIKKYATIPERQKISDCYLSIPRQLAREYTKFQFKIVAKEGNARKYGNSLNWLVDAGMIKFCVNVSTPMFPLVAYEKPEQFKVYVTDIGMLTAMYGFETQTSVLKNTLIGPAKGGIYENLVFDMLVKRGYKLNYYKSENSEREIEFLLQKDGAVIPVEVKSKNGATVSLNNFIKEFKPPYAYKLISGNIGEADTKITLPLYMALFI